LSVTKADLRRVMGYLGRHAAQRMTAAEQQARARKGGYAKAKNARRKHRKATR